MTYLLPYPLMSAFLLTAWLLLNRTLSPGQVVLGTALALTGGWALSWLTLPKGRPRRPLRIVALGLTVFVDILRSNFAVARIILGLGGPATSGFVRIPLDMRSPFGLAALAVIITSTPGTVWVEHDPDGGVLTIHVLDLVDEAAWIGTIKHRYERQLMDIFE